MLDKGNEGVKWFRLYCFNGREEERDRDEKGMIKEINELNEA